MARVPVALVRCESYDPEVVHTAVERAFDLLGGAESLLPRKGTCLVKPNLLSPSRPELAITTNPEVVKAVVTEVQKVVESVVVGDGPGRGDTLGAAEASGVASACRDAGVSVIPFDEGTEFRLPEGRLCKEFFLALPVVQAAAVVSVAKMKTHGFMGYTGAVKNLFGCIPGTRKAKYHLRYQEKDEFGLMLLDLLAAVRPAVSVLDAVVAMDGDGPSHGRPRPFGAILASADPVAVDSVALRLAGVDPRVVPYLKAAGDYGVGAVDSGDVEVLGDPPESFNIKDFRMPGGDRHRSLLRFGGAVKKSITARPVVNFSKCTGCAVCQRSCPPQVISMSQKKAVIDDSRCIRCYCCHEMCPSGAIDLRMGPVARVLDRFIDSLSGK
ncbi:MAG: DUF362 domain-containing protein [Bacillota bacterium]|nr:DUF362 domain-containing protein [Candidatus Fermentithermobacillaceae bacterium]